MLVRVWGEFGERVERFGRLLLSGATKQEFLLSCGLNGGIRRKCLVGPQADMEPKAGG